MTVGMSVDCVVNGVKWNVWFRVLSGMCGLGCFSGLCGLECFSGLGCFK